MSLKSVLRTAVAVMFVPCVFVSALAQMPNPYGLSITLENAKKAVLPALAEAAKNNWLIAVAVVDPAGNLVYYEKMDNTQLGSANVSIDKARSAVSIQTPHEGAAGCLGGGRRRLACACLARSGSRRRWYPSDQRRQDCRSDRSFRRHQCPRRAVRQGRRRGVQIAGGFLCEPLCP